MSLPITQIPRENSRVFRTFFCILDYLSRPTFLLVIFYLKWIRISDVRNPLRIKINIQILSGSTPVRFRKRTNIQ